MHLTLKILGLGYAVYGTPENGETDVLYTEFGRIRTWTVNESLTLRSVAAASDDHIVQRPPMNHSDVVQHSSDGGT